MSEKVYVTEEVVEGMKEPVVETRKDKGKDKAKGVVSKVKGFVKKHKGAIIGGGLALAGGVAIGVLKALNDKESIETETDGYLEPDFEIVYDDEEEINELEKMEEA